MNDFKIVYDLSNEPLKLHWIFILGFVFVYAIILFVSIILKKKLKKGLRKFGIIFGSIGFGISLLIALIIVPHQIGGYNKIKKIFENKEYKFVEGFVEEFEPMPYEGHQNESFSVKNIKFKYSDYDESYYGFNHTKSHGGPIDSGKVVRIYYITLDDRNIILKLETKSI